MSLTRTSRIGYLRDLRRMTVALSRARLGLYILGRRCVFESSLDLKPFFERLLQLPSKLKLVIGEMFPASRKLGDKVDSTEMDGVEHLGQYVFEMTQAKLKSLAAGQEVLPAKEEGTGLDLVEDADQANDEGPEDMRSDEDQDAVAEPVMADDPPEADEATS